MWCSAARPCCSALSSARPWLCCRPVARGSGGRCWPVAGLIQTIPSLALLALFYPLLLALSALTKGLVGHGFPALGFLPSLLALALYSMLPMLRNGGRRAYGRRSGGGGSGQGRRHDRPPAPLAGGGAPRRAGGHGRRAHGGGVGDRHGDPRHIGRADIAWRLHFLRPADRELGAGAVRLRGVGGAGICGGSAARPDRDRPRQAGPAPYPLRPRRAPGRFAGRDQRPSSSAPSSRRAM